MSSNNKLFARYKTDKKLETEGVWVDFGDGIHVKLGRLQSKEARTLRRRLEKPYANMDRVPEEVSEQILNKIMAQVVVKGWSDDLPGGSETIQDEDGTPLACTPENILLIFSKIPDFRDDLVTAAMTRDTFKAEENADKAGN